MNVNNCEFGDMELSDKKLIEKGKEVKGEWISDISGSSSVVDECDV